MKSIATSPELGKKLLEAGVDWHTSDMRWARYKYVVWSEWMLHIGGNRYHNDEHCEIVPAWSISALWEIVNGMHRQPLELSTDMGADEVILALTIFIVRNNG